MKNYFLLLIFLSSLLNTLAMTSDTCKQQPVVSHVFWITLHAREAAIYDSLHQLFVTDLQIPKFFDTETYGTRRYFTVLAGNVILEPCGPFEFHQDFGAEVMTRFNTLAFRPYESAVSSAERLNKLGIEITVKDKDAMLNLTVDELCTDFLPVNISKSIQLQSKDEIIMDSLANELIRSKGGPVGLEYLEEIRLGYSSEDYLQKWAMFLEPLENADKLWILPRKPNIRFVPAEREEISALVFKVRSLEEAALFLKSKGLLGNQYEDWIEMDIGWAHGIRILLTQ